MYKVWFFSNLLKNILWVDEWVASKFLFLQHLLACAPYAKHMVHQEQAVATNVPIAAHLFMLLAALP